MRAGIKKEASKDKNVSYVRLKRNGFRFELSLYRDKLPSKEEVAAKGFVYKWDEILVAPVIFSNAAKNEAAEKKDIASSFIKNLPPADPERLTDQEIWKLIMEKGEILQSQEDRIDHQADDKNYIGKLAAAIVARSHVLPKSVLTKFHETKSDKELAKLRLERYTPADVERELKNIKFKFVATATSMVPDHQVIDAIAAIRIADNIPILRDQRLCVVRLTKDAKEGGTTIAAVSKAFSEMCQPHQGKIVRSTADEVVTVVDLIGDVVQPGDVVPFLQTNAVLKSCDVIIGTGEFYIPRDPQLLDDLTAVSAPAVVAAPNPTKAASSGKAGAKPSGKASEGAVSQAPPQEKTLESQLADLKAGDSDDDDGKKKKSKKKAPQQQQQAPQQPPPKKGKHNEFDSDDEKPAKGGNALKKIEEDDDDDEPVMTMKPKKKK